MKKGINRLHLRKKVKTGFFLLSALFLITSCVDLKQKNQLQQVDALVTSIDSISIILKENPIPQASAMADSIVEVENRFKLYYIPDTIDREVHQEINDLKQARKTFSHLNKDHTNFTAGCKEMKESLRQLRYDIENSDGDRKSYDEYLSFEKSKLADLSRLSKDYIEQKELSEDRYNRLYEKWNSFSLDLKKKHK